MNLTGNVFDYPPGAHWQALVTEILIVPGSPGIHTHSVELAAVGCATIYQLPQVHKKAIITR